MELIEAEKAKLSPEALELWEDLDTSLYLSPEEEIKLKSRMKRLWQVA